MTPKNQMDNINTEIDTVRKNQIEMLKIKNILTKKKNAFNGLISEPGQADKESVN